MIALYHAAPARLMEGRSMAHLKWIIESFFEATEDVKFPDAMSKRLIAVADTSEDVGLHEIDSPCWHRAVEHLAGKVRSAILTPNGRCSGVLGIEKKTGRVMVFDAALKEWWPKIQCEISKVGKPNFKRLHVLLAQENARAAQQNPKTKKPLEKYHQSLVRCLNGVESLVFQSTQKGETASNESANAAKTKHEQPDKPSVTLEVDIPKQRATLKTPKGEKQFELPSEAVARWLKVLADHPDEWIRPADYKTHGGDDLDGVKPSDKLRSLKTKCPRLAMLIDASKHEGMRFNNSQALKSDRAPRCATNR